MAVQIQKSHATVALIFGVIEIIVAIVVAICSFVMAGKANMEKSWTPYWAGIPFVAPGILGIVVGVTKNKCAMIAFMVLNIICFVLQGIGSILILIVLSFFKGWKTYCHTNSLLNQCTCNFSGRLYTYDSNTCEFMSDVSTLMYVIIAFLVIGAVVALASSILSCIAVCCTRNQPQTIVVQQPYIQQPPPAGYPYQQQQPPPAGNQYPEKQYPPQDYNNQQQGVPPGYYEMAK